MKLTVIIPVKNGEKSIKNCLNSLLNQTTKEDYEIIVVDNNSDDRTLEILNSFSNIKVIRNYKKGAYSSRNIGIKNSSGELIFFMDSDCIAQRDLIENIFSYDKKFGYDVIQGRSLYNYSSNEVAYLIQTRYDEIFFDSVLENKEECCRIDTRNCVIKRKIFDQIGYFDEACTIWGDLEFGYRIIENGGRISYNKEMVIYHENLKTLKKYTSKLVQEGEMGYLFLRRKGKSFTRKYFKNLLFIHAISLKYNKSSVDQVLSIKERELEKQIIKFETCCVNEKYLIFKNISDICTTIGVLKGFKKI